jgi:parvulin-like peptidyl-prolyl isomerase
LFYHSALVIRYLLCALFLAAVPASGAAQGSQDAILAKAGSLFITEREFRERFELTPGPYRHRKGGLEQEKAVFLYSLIAEKLLFQEALEKNFDGDSLFQRDLHDLTALLARDELYRQEVSAKISVSAAELREGIRHALKELLVSYLFFSSAEDAKFVRSRIGQGKDFARLGLDSTLDVARDTATIVWGDADTAIEEAAYRLPPGGVSPVIHAGDGWYILKLDQVNPSLFYGRMQAPVLRERVLMRIRQREERWRMATYVDHILRHGVEYSPPGPFRLFAEACAAAAVSESSFVRFTVGKETRDRLVNGLAPNLNDTLIVAGHTIWSIGATIERLYAKGFSCSLKRRTEVGRSLYEEFHDWVSQELLAQEAMRRGIDRLETVRRQVEPWRAQALAFRLIAHLNRNVDVSDAEVMTFAASRDTGIKVPEVKIRALHTTSLERMQVALGVLEHGTSLADVVRRFATPLEDTIRGGESEFFPATSRPPIGDLAWQMDTGQQYGPVRDSSGYWYFELLAKRTAVLASDTAAITRLKEAKTELLRMKRRKVLDEYLAQTAQRRGYSIFEDRLRALNVSPIPMLAYRFIGFGGRMFAAPFVQKLIDWVSTPPPETPIVP